MSFSLAQISEKVRERADMQNSTFVSAPELTGYINASYAELYDILVSRFEDYYSTAMSFTIATGNAKSLPTDLYKVRGLDFLSDPSNPITVRRFMFEERNRMGQNATALYGAYDRSYRVMGQSIMILPISNGPGPYQLWYIPRYTPLVSDADLMGDVLDFEEYVVVDAAMKCLLKEESDVSALFSMKQGLLARIEAMASNRDTSPERIADVRSDYNDQWPFVRGY